MKAPGEWTVRLASPEDVPVLLWLGKALHAGAERYHQTPWSEAVVHADAWAAVAAGSAFLVEHAGRVVGMVLGRMERRESSYQAIAVDAVRYVVPEARGSVAHDLLLQALEAWAVGMGAVEVVVTDSCTSARDAAVADRYYRRREYLPVARTWAKPLKSAP